MSFGEPRLVAEIHTAARRARPNIYEPRAVARVNIFGCVVAISHFVLEIEEIELCSLHSNASESHEPDPWWHGSEGPRSARRSALLATYWLLVAHSQRSTLALRSGHSAIWH